MKKYVDYLTNRTYREARNIIRKKELHLNNLEEKMCQQFGEELAEEVDGEILDVEGLIGYQVVVSKSPEDGSSSLVLNVKIADWYIKENGGWSDSDSKDKDGYYWMSLYESDLKAKIDKLIGDRFDRVMIRKNWITRDMGRKDIIAKEELAS